MYSTPQFTLSIHLFIGSPNRWLIYRLSMLSKCGVCKLEIPLLSVQDVSNVYLTTVFKSFSTKWNSVQSLRCIIKDLWNIVILFFNLRLLSYSREICNQSVEVERIHSPISITYSTDILILYSFKVKHTMWWHFSIKISVLSEN